jgi:hypothetical protein
VARRINSTPGALTAPADRRGADGLLAGDSGMLDTGLPRGRVRSLPAGHSGKGDLVCQSSTMVHLGPVAQTERQAAPALGGGLDERV